MRANRLARTGQASSLFALALLTALAACAPIADDLERTDGEEASAEVQSALTTVVHRASTTASALGATSLGVVKPAGVVSGDVLIARISNRNQVGATLTVPSGWTLLRSDQSASQLKTWIAWKKAGSSEPSSYAFGVSVASNVAGSISAFSGADPTNPIDAVSGQKNGNSATLAAPPVTTTSSSGLAVWFGTQLWGGSACPSSPLVPPSGFTEAFDTCQVSTSTGNLFDMAWKQLGAAGAQPAWNGSSPFPNTNTAQVVTLRPAGGATCSAGNTYSGTVTDVGSLTDTGIVEVSGLAMSRINPGVIYAHSENNANFVAMNKANAAVVGSYASAFFPWDWEDVATGPCPAGSCIFMGDIGKSSGHPPPEPTTFAVYRMPEPNIAAGQTSGTRSGDLFPFQYPDGAKNAEALMVHPTTGDIYVVTKAASGASKAYKFPKPLPAPGTMSTLVKVADMQLPAGANDNFRSVTAGAIHPCADRFLLRTYGAVYEYRASAGAAFETAFTATPVSLTSPIEGQGEAIEYDLDGSGFFTMSERTAAPYVLKRVARQ